MNKKYTFTHLAVLLLVGISNNIFAQKLFSSGSNPLFTFNISSNSITAIGSFSPANIGGPVGRLVYIGNGEIVGIANQSPNLYGALFKTDTLNGNVSVHYQFNNNNRPQSSFELANNGKLYCLAYTGTNNESAIYSFDLSNNIYTKEYEIAGNANSGIYGGFVKAGNGLLYGVTKRGGINDKGTIFSFNPASNAYTKLYDFSSSTGDSPEAAMIQGADGKLYGVTSYGGANDKGVIFSFNTGSNTYIKLYDFVQSTGENPTSPLYQGSNGNLYGTTMTGGAYYQGTLYKFDLTGNIYTCLHSFFAGDGYGPRVPPIEGAPGMLYGHTNQGGSNFAGSIYSYDLVNSTFTKLLNGNSVSGSFMIPFMKFYLTTGLNESNKIARNLSVFPNPCIGKFQVKFDSSEKIEIMIYNQLGEIVYSNSKIESGFELKTELVPGLYYCKFSANGSYIATQKLVVNQLK